MLTIRQQKNAQEILCKKFLVHFYIILSFNGALIKNSYIWPMKDKTWSDTMRNVLHKGHEGQNSVGHHEKCPS